MPLLVLKPCFDQTTLKNKAYVIPSIFKKLQDHILSIGNEIWVPQTQSQTCCLRPRSGRLENLSQCQWTKLRSSLTLVWLSQLQEAIFVICQNPGNQS